MKETKDLLGATRKKHMAELAVEIQAEIVGAASLHKARMAATNMLAINKSNLVPMCKTNGRLTAAIEQGQAKLSNLEPKSQMAEFDG